MKTVTPLTVAEANAILFVGAGLIEFCSSLRADQVAALNDLLDVSQKILAMKIVTTTSPTDDGFIGDAMRMTWSQLVASAKERIAAFEDEGARR